MHRALTVAVTGFCAVAAISSPGKAQAQANDTLPFRKGQWAVEFPLQESYSITLLRFRSNRHALLVDGAVSISNDKSEGETSTFERRYSSQRYILRIGRRAYRPLAFNTAGYVDYGVVPSWARSSTKYRSDSGTGYEASEQTASLGLFAALGGNYFVTPRLSLGMSSSTTLAYRLNKERVRSRSPGTVTDRNASGRGYGFTAHTAVITGAIYF